MKHLVSKIALAGLVLGTTVVSAMADDDVAALVVDNGPFNVPSGASWAIFAIGITGLVAVGLRRRK